MERILFIFSGCAPAHCGIELASPVLNRGDAAANRRTVDVHVKNGKKYADAVTRPAVKRLFHDPHDASIRRRYDQIWSGRRRSFRIAEKENHEKAEENQYPAEPIPVQYDTNDSKQQRRCGKPIAVLNHARPCQEGKLRHSRSVLKYSISIWRRTGVLARGAVIQALRDVTFHLISNFQFQFFEGGFLLKVFQIQVGGVRNLYKLCFVF